MKRSYLKIKPYKLKRSALNKKSSKRVLIDECKNLLRKILKIQRGAKCELSDRQPNALGLFHILPEGRYPRISLHPQNILLANWMPYHYAWHHDPHQKDEIENKIKKLRGNNYLDELKVLNAIAPKLSMFRIGLIYESLKQELSNSGGER